MLTKRDILVGSVCVAAVAVVVAYLQSRGTRVIQSSGGARYIVQSVQGRRIVQLQLEQAMATNVYREMWFFDCNDGPTYRELQAIPYEWRGIESRVRERWIDHGKGAWERVVVRLHMEGQTVYAWLPWVEHIGAGTTVECWLSKEP